MSLNFQDIKPINDSLLCSLCNKLLSDPCNFNACGHNYCWSCVIQKQSKTCPVCKVTHINYLEKDPLLNELVSLCRKLYSNLESSTNNCKKLNENSKIFDIKILLDKSECIKHKDSKENIKNENIVDNSLVSNRCTKDLLETSKSSNDGRFDKIGRKSYKLNSRGESLLHLASIKGDLDKVVSIIDQARANDNLLQLINAKDFAGWTALHEACNHGKDGVASHLLCNGADVNASGFEGLTPLHDAVANGHIACVRKLLHYGASVGIRNSMGLLPIDFATDEAIRTLISERTDIEKSFSEKPLTMCHLGSIANISHIQDQTGLITDNLLVLLTSGTTDRDMEVDQPLDKFKKFFGATVLDKHDLEVTHLIVFGCLKITGESASPDNVIYTAPKRNPKYMRSLLKGIWILRPEWLIDSLKSQRILPEDPYELRGCGNELFSNPSSAPTKARLNQQNKLPDLFTGCNFYLKGNFGPPFMNKSEIITLIKMGRGNILTQDPARHHKRSSAYDHVTQGKDRCQIFDPSLGSVEGHFLRNCEAIVLIPPTKQPSGAKQKNYLKGYYLNKSIDSNHGINGETETNTFYTYVGNSSSSFDNDNNCKGEGNGPAIVILDTDWLLASICRFELIDCVPLSKEAH